MADIIKFPGENIEFTIIDNVRVSKPQNRAQYVAICKTILDKEDYEELLCCIMDEEYYNQSETWVKNIIDAYYGFKY